MSRLLLLEDDPSLAKSLCKYLQQEGYTVDWAKHGDEAADWVFDQKYDLYLIDINVPLLSGTDLLSSLRGAGDTTPAIIITAQVDTASVTEGFIAGADDYLKKPFDPEELLIRIKARTSRLNDTLKFGDIEVDMQRLEIRKSGELVSLGDVQRALLVVLIQNHPNPVTKDEMLLLLEKPTDLALRVNISKLKKNLGLNIRAVRGVGYQIL